MDSSNDPADVLFDSSDYRTDDPIDSGYGLPIAMALSLLATDVAILLAVTTWSYVPLWNRGLLALLLGLVLFALGYSLALDLSRAIGRWSLVIRTDGIAFKRLLRSVLGIPPKSGFIQFDQIRRVVFVRNSKGPEIVSMRVVGPGWRVIRFGSRSIPEMNVIHDITTGRWRGKPEYLDGRLVWSAEQMGVSISHHANRLNPQRFPDGIPGLGPGQPRCPRNGVEGGACRWVAIWKWEELQWYCPGERCYVTDVIPLDPEEIRRSGPSVLLVGRQSTPS